MKRIFSIILAAVIFSMGAMAQSAADLAREQRDLQNILRKSLDAKPTKEAKKQAKQYKKEGWLVPAGERSIEQQITESQFLGAELMVDENGSPTKRFIQHTAFATAGSYNAAYAAARTNAQAEVAAMLETELAAAVESKLDNAQHSTINATTVDKFHERIKGIIQATMTNSIPALSFYRRLPNNNFEVQVRIAYDKKELAARMKRALQQELENEGDELLPLVDEALRNSL